MEWVELVIVDVLVRVVLVVLLGCQQEVSVLRARLSHLVVLARLLDHFLLTDCFLVVVVSDRELSLLLVPVQLKYPGKDSYPILTVGFDLRGEDVCRHFFLHHLG